MDVDWGALLVGSPRFLTQAAILVGRVALGVFFVAHALGKLGVVGEGGMQGFVELLESLGVRMAPVQARVIVVCELLGGLALVLGFFTRPACLLLIATLSGVGRFRLRGAGRLLTNVSVDAAYTLSLGVMCFVFLLLGPGLVSLDAILF